VRAVVFRAPLAYWESAPRRYPEKRIPLEEQERRAERWYRAHAATFPVSCAQAWPPIPLYPRLTAETLASLHARFDAESWGRYRRCG
jgi:hypothetical protein